MQLVATITDCMGGQQPSCLRVLCCCSLLGRNARGPQLPLLLRVGDGTRVQLTALEVGHSTSDSVSCLRGVDWRARHAGPWGLCTHACQSVLRCV